MIKLRYLRQRTRVGKLLLLSNSNYNLEVFSISLDLTPEDVKSDKEEQQKGKGRELLSAKAATSIPLGWALNKMEDK